MTEPGGVPQPHTLTALELSTGKIHRYGPAELAQLSGPPFPPDQTLVAFAADAELSCYLSLGWPLPETVIDLRIEHMMCDLNTGSKAKGAKSLGANLEGALAFYGLTHAVENKSEMQVLAGKRVPETPEEIEKMVAYCWEDVAATKKLWDVMESKLDDSSLWRGRYMKAVTRIHARGIPLDMVSYSLIRQRAHDLKMMWIRKLDPNCEIFDEVGSYKVKRFAEYLEKRGLLSSWLKTPKTGQPSKGSDAIRDVTAAHPSNVELAKLGELFNTENLLKNFSLTMDSEGRGRAGFFNAFGTSTGRNAPHGYIFAPAKWVRSLIKPAPGMAVAYMDWVSMEVGVGAKLSGDEKLMEAYLSGDAHMMLAKQGGMAPMDASKSASKSPYACGPGCGGSDAGNLLRLYDEVANSSWPWFEPYLSYSNAKLPHGLIAYGRVFERHGALVTGLDALRWLEEQQSAPDGAFLPVGSERVYRAGEARPLWDGQPVEIYATVAAALEAHRATGDAAWIATARRALEWLVGRNALRTPLHDAETGGCRDGLHRDRANANQGAESTLSLWLSVAEYNQAARLAAIRRARSI